MCSTVLEHFARKGFFSHFKINIPNVYSPEFQLLISCDDVTSVWNDGDVADMYQGWQEIVDV